MSRHPSRPAIDRGIELMTLRAYWWILMGIALPVPALEETALRADQALFFSSDKLDRDDPTANVFKLTGARRIIDKCPLNPYRGTVVIRLTPKEPFGGYPTYVTIDPGPP